MARLTRDAILSAPVPTLEVEFPEWGGSALVRAMTFRDRVEMLDAINVRANEVDLYEADQKLPEADRDHLAKVEQYDETLLRVLFSLVDDDGERLFTLEDYPRLREINYPTIVRAYRALTALERPQVDDVEALKKSSDTIPSDDSSSA